MSICSFCNGTKVEPGHTDCVWCDNTGVLALGDNAQEVVLPNQVELMNTIARLKAENQALQDRLTKADQDLDSMCAVFGSYGNTLIPFVQLMRKELEANSHKGDREGWLQMTVGTALAECKHHYDKMYRAVHSADREGIREHTADVANCAMMLLDVSGLLPVARKDNGQSES